MQEHLSDEQLTERLLNAPGDPASQAHLTACPACREEEEGLRQLLAGYRQATNAMAERPASFWHGQQGGLAARWTGHSTGWRLAWAATVAAVVLTAILMQEKTPPAKSFATTDPDHALLVDVERSVRREVPRALEPAALLAQELSRDANAQPNP